MGYAIITGLFFIFILVYTWGVYPAILLLLERRCTKPAATENTEKTLHVAVILSAYNEEKHLAARVRNLRELDYPSELLDIYVGLDGCSDKSMDEVVSASGGSDNVHISDFPTRRGKVVVLKDLVRKAVSDNGNDILLLFTDANTTFQNNVLGKVLPYFADGKIGGVCGRLIFKTEMPGNAESCNMPETSYWGLETKFKIAESCIDSCLGANGAIYIIRAPLFCADIPDNTLIDDFVLGMKIREQGWRLIYEPDAIAMEELPDTSAEWARRVRIGAGGYQAVKLCGRCLLPDYGRFAWMFWSHKILRWFTPHITLALIIFFTIWLLGYNGNYRQIIYIITGIVVAGIGIIALLAKFYEGNKNRGKIIDFAVLLWHFFVMQAALFVGFIKYCRGGLSGHWTRTPR